MKHIMFPTAADADAFLADVQQQGATLGNATYTRRGTATDGTYADGTVTGDASAGAEDAGAGAVKGTGVGAVVGAAAGFLATAGTVAAGVATGGLAVPVILGMAALGSGVGAAVGATGGAMGIDENRDGRTADTGDYYEADDSYYDRMDSTVSGGGRVVAVQDPVPANVMDAATRHGGEMVDAGDSVSRMDRGNMTGGTTVGHATDAAGSKIDEAADRLRATGHSAAASVTGNPEHDRLAAEDRARADMNNREADAAYDATRTEARDGDRR